MSMRPSGAGRTLHLVSTLRSGPCSGPTAAAGEQRQGVAGTCVHSSAAHNSPRASDPSGVMSSSWPSSAFGAGVMMGSGRLIVLAQALRQGCAAEGAVASSRCARHGRSGGRRTTISIFDGPAGAAHDHLGTGMASAQLGTTSLVACNMCQLSWVSTLALKGNAARGRMTSSTDAVGGHQHQAAIGQV